MTANFSLGCGPLVDTARWCYHYTTHEAAIGHILPQNTLRFNPLCKVNDPKESGCFGWLGGPVSNRPELREKYVETEKKVDQVFRQRTKVFCASKDRHPARTYLDRGHMKPRMWAQYADNARGICLVFDRLRLEATARERFGDTCLGGGVEYTNEGRRMSIPRMDDDALDLSPIDIARSRFLQAYDQMLLTKHLDWSNEDEWRLIFFDEDAGERYLDFGDSLAAIVVTNQCVERYVSHVREAAKLRGIIAFRIRWNHSHAGGSRLN